MNERIKFIAGYLEKDDSFTDLCDRFRISRKTGYKWMERYEVDGVKALSDRSRAPLSHPHALSDGMRERILSIRKRHPRWGPRKLIVVMRRQEPELHFPAASTVGEVLRKHGLAHPKKRTRRNSQYHERLGGYDAPNSVWCADFKGHFPVSGKRCHPLTITDGFSRFLIRCQAMKRPLFVPVQRGFESAFREYGLPDAIRTDNGPPFSSLAPAGLSRLGVWWIRLGIRPERILPGRPDQNGRHERMHSTLKAETAKPPRLSFPSQQRAFDRFQEEFNQVRPHEALDQAVPASLYRPSLRPFPKRVPELEYPSHFQVCKAYPNGVISFQSTQWIISSCLRNEWVGLEEVSTDCWKVYCGPLPIGILDLRHAKDRKDRQFGPMIRLDGNLNTRRRGRPYRR
jgi:transposase InsO family protein